MLRTASLPCRRHEILFMHMVNDVQYSVQTTRVSCNPCTKSIFQLMILKYTLSSHVSCVREQLSDLELMQNSAEVAVALLSIGKPIAEQTAPFVLVI